MFVYIDEDQLLLLCGKLVLLRMFFGSLIWEESWV